MYLGNIELLSHSNYVKTPYFQVVEVVVVYKRINNVCRCIFR